MAAKKETKPVETVRIRLLESVVRGGETLPAGTELDVPVRRAAIWFEGQVCEYAG